MQPPPQAGPPGMGGPPRMGMGNNAYWRKRGPNPVSSASTSVQPVTDPFAFGRMTPQSMAQGSAPTGNPLMAPSPSPSMYPQPVPVHGSGAGDQGHVSPPSLVGAVPQPVARGEMYTSVSAPSAASAPFTNYPAAAPIAQPGLGNMQTYQNTASGLENAFVPVQSRAQSAQGLSTAPYFAPAPSQPTSAPWGSLPNAPPVSNQNFPLPVQQQSHNSPYYSPPYLEVSNLAPQASETGAQPAQQRAAPGYYPPTSVSNPTFQHSSSQPPSLNPTDYMHGQNPEQNWFNQPYKDQRHPPLPSSNPVQYPPPQQPEPHQEVPSASGRVSTNADSGTISMFFKGEEEENVEIVSSDQQNASIKADLGSSHYQNAGYQGVSSLLPQPTVSSGIPAMTPITLASGVPHVPSSAGNATHPHSAWRQDTLPLRDNTAKPREMPYDNVENIECVQNQEVLPNEPNHFNPYPPNVTSDAYRYGPVPGPPLPKNVSGHPEVGPNLETPDTVGCPVRPDSVSSNYSNLSLKSLPVPTRSQEHAGTFIQKESGRLEGDSSHSFFKQIDSSPMTGDAVGQNMGQHKFHSSLSQPPTPSPPKPTGIFMTSANSSFEPVRSHSIGLKPSDADQSKMGGEGHKVLQNASIPVASPGNLEQPPDNLETIFLGKRNSHGTVTSNGSLFHSVGEPPLDNVSLLLDRRPSSRAQGSSKKCESPATTLWAQGELPNFGGNVLLAPAAPSLYVPPKPQTEIIQPPEDGSYDSRAGGTDPGKFQASPEEQISSENLENPPKIGDEEQLSSQASSGYASLLSSPPTEALQNQPVLIAQPNKTYNLAQPINFSLSLPNQVKNVNSLKEPGTAEKQGPQSLPPAVGNFSSNENAPFSLTQGRPEVPNQSNYKSAAPNDKFSESLPNQHSVLQRQSSANQAPLNLAAESQKVPMGENATVDFANKTAIPTTAPMGPRFPANPNCRPSYPAEKSGALDFTVPRAPLSSVANNVALSNSQPVAGGPLVPGQPVGAQNGQAGLDINKQGFYQQVTKDGPPQQPAKDIPHHGGVAPQEYMVPASHPLPLVPPAQAPPGGKPVSYPLQAESQVPASQNPIGAPYNSAPEPAPKYGPTEQPPYPAQPVPSSSAPVNLNHTATYQEQPRPPASHTPQQADPYYYYRSYGAYPQPYGQPYQQVDPRAAPLYYQDPYGAYDPAYRQYSGTAYANPGKYPYQEPERPSSRSSHCSDRPSSRQGYSSKSDWSGYYPGYYQSQYDYADPARWDRYPAAYDPGYRDPRSNYWNYMYNSRDDAYQRNVPAAYTSRYDVYEDRWQYDPRYVGGFDDEPQRDLAKDDFDRRSIHSEHSAHSMHSGRSNHSRRSSFSSHSQHSQIYKSQPDLTASAYEPQIQNPPLNEYSYGMYPNDYSAQQGLDNYSYGYPKATEWQPVEQVPSRPLTPEKFGSPHVCARFGPGGQLIKVLPNLPSDGQPALVEIHNMEVVMQNSAEQEQLRAFPGPLVKDETHKVDVINFAQKKSKECSQNESLLDQESACLVWDFIVLLCRQNGTVVGTDIAELLLRDHKTVWLPGKSPNEANLIDFSNEPLEQREEESGASQLSFLTDTLQSTGEALEKETERFRELLLFGRKKDALESAMKTGLWGHALLLASKMDSRTHARVMTRFANSLPINDPLQTVYQLLSGRMPAAATCCGDEKWGDWRPHLAMVLSNLTNNVDVPTRAMTAMGDTLASRGLLDASHVCYLMAQVGFGIFTKKSTKLVLIGSNHSLSFARFCTNEAIQRTEAYEYAQSLGTQSFSLPNIQVYKFIYACRLAEHGLSAQAFHYCEVISKTVLRHPSCYSPVLVSQLLEVSSHLRFCDPQLKEKPEQELFIDPPWLQHLRTLDQQMKHGTVVYDTGRTTPQQFACSTPSSDMDHVSQSDGAGTAADVPTHTDNPLLASLLPNMMPPVQAVLVPAGPENPAPMYPSYPGNDPSHPGTPQGLAPSSGPPTPATAPGFVPFGGEQAPIYPPAPLQPYLPPPQAADYAPPMQMNQDPGLQRIQQNSPTKTTFHDPEVDFYGVMAKMGPGQRSRTVSQSSSHMRRTRTTSESSTHSIGSGRRSSMSIQPSPPPIPEADRAEEKKEHKPRGPSQGSGRSWFPLKFGWLMGKGKNEAHLPDDRNKSIVWDEKKQKWVNMDEPEEESKPLPPPPPGMLKKPQSTPAVPGGPPNPSVNVFSIRAAGARGRYVDVLNPGGPRPTNSVPPPADLFAPLAPMPIPTNLFVPNAVPEEAHPAEASGAEMVPAAGQMGPINPPQAQLPGLTPGLDQDEGQMGELSRSSSLSSLSREVSQHMEQASANMAPASGPPPTGAVPFYNPSQFAQQPPSAPTGGLRPGRLGQRKYPSLK
ncbi:hypothetical protein XENTR_v10020098 [Xenopus tropicalis]|uniref:Protein transport protein sec16 n=1 Tax=Xenopus tropicalis TaxID=8364 RepID=A0A6I8QVE7_XENTR|nr:protein transport protein Sec16A isoform X1 [Xenopus tropicalis]KAE8582378.1 hypothetical protein XENTR_v10020098 [Xenopus tropicalis]